MKNLLTYLLLAVFIISCQKDEIVDESQSDQNANVVESHEYISIKLSNNERITLKKVEDYYLLDEDIIISQEQLDQIKSRKNEKGAVLSDLSKRWPNGKVYYKIDSSIPYPNDIYAGIAMWESEVPGLEFIQSTNPSGFLNFKYSTSNTSYLGYQGNDQPIYLVNYNVSGIVAHEIGHAIGMFHEQCRSDRDQSLIIKWENIQVGAEYNFKTYVDLSIGGLDIGSLDYNSIMMYGSTYFTKNGQPTITKLDGSTFNANRSYLSQSDISSGKYMYPAPEYASISGPIFGNNSDYYTWSVSFSGGTSPFTYEWTRTNSLGEVSNWGFNSNSNTAHMPLDQDLDLSVKITDANGKFTTATHYTTNTGSGGKPGR